MATTSKKRTVALKDRQATVTNLNFSPEKSGDALVERADMSIEFLVVDKEVDELINSKSNPLKVLWHNDGSPQLRELAKLEIDLKAEGLARFGVSEEHMIEFKAAVLKKISITPYIDRQLGVKCQVRIDPTGHLEDLAEMVINKSCIFAFDGSGVASGGGSADQGNLEV